MISYAVEAHDLGLSYKSTVALDGVDLQVPRGSTLGVLGHNGAGKTSLIRVLTTSLRADRGQVSVDGIDVAEHPALVRRRIGVTGQYAGLDEFLTTAENLELMARLSGLRQDARARVTDLVERFDLHPFASRRVGSFPAVPGAGSTWPRAWWLHQRCSSSTSPPPAWTRLHVRRCGTWSVS